MPPDARFARIRSGCAISCRPPPSVWLRSGAARKSPILEPARRLIDDEAFWRNQAQGLALFLAPGFDRLHKVPIDVPERLTVGGNFCIRPLLPLLDAATRFWLLAVTAGRSRLYQGAQWSFSEVHGLALPQGIAAVASENVYEEAHQAAPTGRPQRGPAGLAHAQSFGEAPDELRKTELIELLHRVAAATEPAIRREPAPVILAGPPEIQGNFREVAHWKELLPEGILGNPDAMSADDLHRRAWRLMAPRQNRVRDEAVGRLHSLIGTGNGKATSKAEEIVKAAHYGRVDQLLLCDGATLWGRFVEGADRIVAHGTPDADDDDLFDYAALMTLRHGGKATLVDRGQLPSNSAAAAILRY